MPDTQVAAFPQEVNLGYDTGSDRLLLRHPQVVAHTIDAKSPLRRWTHPEGVPGVHAQLIVVLEAQTYLTSANMIRTATFELPRDVRHGCRFAPMFAERAGAAAMEAAMDWRQFHAVLREGESSHGSGDALRRLSFGQGLLDSAVPSIHVTPSKGDSSVKH